MTRLVFPGGGTPDALPSGAYVVPIIGSHIATTTRRLALPLGQDIAYPRLHPNGEYFACQIHDGEKKDHVFEFVGLDAEGKPRWIDHGYWPSVSPCLYKPDGTLVINGRDGYWGSQGLRYVTEGGIVVSADDTYGSAAYGLSEFTPIPGGAIGQTHDNNQDDAAVHINGALRLVEPGPCRFIRASAEGEQAAVAIWKPGQGAVLGWPTLSELRALPPVPNVGTPVPNPGTPSDPPTEPEPAPMDYLQIIRDIREDYPTPLGTRHWEFLVEVAQATGTQLYRKEDDNSVLIPSLRKRVSLDIIGRGTLGNRWADILQDSEGQAIPTFQVQDGANGEYVDVSQVELPGELPPAKPPQDPPPAGDLESRVRVLEQWMARVRA
jgi:hypothetical protein